MANASLSPLEIRSLIVQSMGEINLPQFGWDKQQIQSMLYGIQHTNWINLDTGMVKDQIKANVSESFIGVGTIGSSTDKYRKIFEGLKRANHLKYDEGEVVFVSINGKRPKRCGIGAIEKYLKAAIRDKAVFVTDNVENTQRGYNLGEREVAVFLEANGYERSNGLNYSVWKPM